MNSLYVLSSPVNILKSRIGCAILAILPMFFLALSAEAAESSESELLLLDGNWKKVVGQHLLPVGDMADRSIWIDVQIPEEWPIDVLNRSPSNPNINPRIATYVRELPFSSPRSGLYLQVGEIYSAFDLYLSNQAGSFTKIASNGDISFPNRDGQTVFSPIALPEIPANARLVFQLSAEGYPSTRLVTAPILGEAVAVTSRIWITRTLVALIIGGFLAISIHNLFLWVSGSRRQSEYLAIAMLSLTMMMRIAANNQLIDILIWYVFDVVPTTELASRVSWFTFPMVLLLWVGIIRSLFPKDVGLVLMTIFIAPSMLVVASALLTSPEVYITIGTYFRLLMPLFFVLSVYVVVRVLWNRRAGAMAIFVGIIIFIIGPIYDLVFYQQGRYFYIEVSSITMLTFCILQSLQIGRSYTRSLEAASQLSGELKSLNQNLESQVQERTSALRTANENLEQQAMTDPLTELANRRAFMAVFEREIEKVKRYQRSFVLAMVDIDLFKAVNDTWGHDVGDKVIIAVAEELKGIGRDSDVVSRYGGEEFVILLLETDAETGRHALERMRSNIESLEINVDGASIKVTASFGMTVCVKMEALNEVLKRADEALYQAKNNGRNQLVFKK